jgi:hypothetical protein
MKQARRGIVVHEDDGLVLLTRLQASQKRRVIGAGVPLAISHVVLSIWEVAPGNGVEQPPIANSLIMSRASEFPSGLVPHSLDGPTMFLTSANVSRFLARLPGQG